MSEEREKTEGVDKEDFKHIVRILDTDLNGNRRVLYSLCGITGIGRRVARNVVLSSGVDPNAKMGNLTNEDIGKLKVSVEGVEKRLPWWMLNRRKDLISGDDLHIMGTDMELKFREDINLLRKIRSYRGIRHERGLRVRGQRTKSTGRRGMVVGVVRKKILAKTGGKRDGPS